jgi:arginyl-tRNA synthetase
MKEDLKKWISETLDIQSDFAVEHPKELSHGDYAVNVALIEGKKLGKNPRELADAYVVALRQAQGDLPIQQIETAGPGFINIHLKPEYFAEEVGEAVKEGEKFGENKVLQGKKYFIEHTQPNPFKYFHIGHLMNNAIGESLARIIKANGAETKVVGYHGDIGLHVAKAIWGQRELTKSNLGTGNLFNVGSAYPLGADAYEKDENAKKEIIEINKHVFAKDDDEINKLYELGRKISIDNFEVLYQKLDSNFDIHFYESESGEVGKELVLKNVPKVFEESEGAIVFKGENFVPKTHTRVFLNKEGLPTYEAKEVGLAQMKKDYWPYDFSLTVTANEQDSFFKVVEVAIGEVFPELKGKLEHISHGLLKLPSGKMSSRTGNIVTAETLINLVKSEMLEKMEDRNMSKEEKEKTAEIIAIGAIKYSILHQAIGGDIIFDFDKSLSFEGDSGPYLQYAYVRSQSVIKKAKEVGVVSGGESSGAHEVSLWETWQTTTLEKLIARFPEVVIRAGEEYAPHYIATYLTELAASFNNFYVAHKIADVEDKSSGYKLALTQAFGVVMKKGLDLLGIKVPVEM